MLMKTCIRIADLLQSIYYPLLFPFYAWGTLSDISQLLPESKPFHVTTWIGFNKMNFYWSSKEKRICFDLTHYSLVKVNRKVQEEPQAEVAANPWHQKEEKKLTQINVCIANKQMHYKHKDQLPRPQARWSKHLDKEQGKTKHEAPRSVNYRATKNKKTSGPPP